MKNIKEGIIISYLGEIAALGSALGMVVCSISFEAAGKKVGSLTVNITRLIIGMAFLALTAYCTRGIALPVDATMKSYTYLGISGFIGMFLGDLFMFESFVLLGARITTLIMTLVPVVTAMSAWIILGERLNFLEIVAILLTVGGILLVMLYKGRGGAIKKEFPVKGILCAMGGVMGQALGMVFSKIGVEGYDPIASTQIRLLVAIVAFIVLITIKGRWNEVRSGIGDLKAMKWIGVGSFFGPFIGVTAMLVALKHANAGIVSTLSSTSPVLVIPFSVVIFRERICMMEVVGAIISVVGVSLFFI